MYRWTVGIKLLVECFSPEIAEYLLSKRYYRTLGDAIRAIVRYRDILSQGSPSDLEQLTARHDKE